MATIKCGRCRKDANNTTTGIYEVKNKETGKTKLVCGECKDKMVESGKWTLEATAKGL